MVKQNVRVAGWLYVVLMFFTGPLKTSGQDHVVKRSDDSNPLEAVVSKLSQNLSALQAEVQALKNAAGKRAMFQTGLSHSVTANSPIPFRRLHSVGGGYEQHTGIYTAPFSGIYSLEFQLSPRATDKAILIDLYRNGAIVARARCNEASFTTSCFSGQILHLDAGDEVWVRADHAFNVYSSIQSFFCGSLVFPDP